MAGSSRAAEMKLITTQTDQDTVDLKIAPTGGALDPLPLGADGVTHKPYNGGYKVDWGDGNISTLVPPRIGVPPADVPDVDHYVNATHTYGQQGSFRGYVEGDARIRFHALSS